MAPTSEWLQKNPQGPLGPFVPLGAIWPWPQGPQAPKAPRLGPKALASRPWRRVSFRGHVHPRNAPLHQAQSLIMFGLFRFLFSISTDASRYHPFWTGRFTKTEIHTEAPMTQLGRAATSSTIINHVWFVSFFVFSFN